MMPFVEYLFLFTEAVASRLSALPFFINPIAVLYPFFLAFIDVSLPLMLSIGPTLLILSAGIQADIQTATIEKPITKSTFIQPVRNERLFFFSDYHMA